uniref:RNA-binding protein 5 n=1 Tax=Lygus hesperus TaxID=30085 RepID=A0A146M320_LYGHE
MDEIDALNEEWNKIKSRNSQLEDSARGANSNSSDACNSSGRRRKKSRWSDDKIVVNVSDKCPENTVKTTAVINDFSQNISPLVEERKHLERLAQERSDAAEIQAGGSNGNQMFGATAEKTPKRLNPGPHCFKLSDNDDDEDEKPQNKELRFKKQRKYRFKKDSSNSESEGESSVVKTPSNFAFRQVSKGAESPVLEDTNSGISSYLSSEPTAPEATLVGPFLEKKTTVIVKNVADWVTAAHILQDVKNAQLRSYEDVGIVRKRERGSAYRYAYVDFLTHTSARRWVDIRKGKIVIGSQTYQMELTLSDWECPKCKVFNFGKSVLCYSCRNPKKVLLQTAVE